MVTVAGSNFDEIMRTKTKLRKKLMDESEPGHQLHLSFKYIVKSIVFSKLLSEVSQISG